MDTQGQTIIQRLRSEYQRNTCAFLRLAARREMTAQALMAAAEQNRLALSIEQRLGVRWSA